MTYLIDELERLPSGTVTVGNTYATAVRTYGGVTGVRALSPYIGYGFTPSAGTTNSGVELRYSGNSEEIRDARARFSYDGAVVSATSNVSILLFPQGADISHDVSTDHRISTLFYPYNGNFRVTETSSAGVVTAEDTATVSLNSSEIYELRYLRNDNGSVTATILTTDFTVVSSLTISPSVSTATFTAGGVGVADNNHIIVERVQVGNTLTDVPSDGILIHEDFETLPAGTVTQAWATGRPGRPTLSTSAGTISIARSASDALYGFGLTDRSISGANFTEVNYPSIGRAIRLVGSVTPGGSSAGTIGALFKQTSTFQTGSSTGNPVDGAKIQVLTTPTINGFIDHVNAAGVRTGFTASIDMPAVSGVNATTWNWIMDVWITPGDNTVSSRYAFRKSSDSIPVESTDGWIYGKVDWLVSSNSVFHWATLVMGYGSGTAGGKNVWTVTIADDIKVFGDTFPARWWDGASFSPVRLKGMWDGTNLLPLKDNRLWTGSNYSSHMTY